MGRAVVFEAPDRGIQGYVEYNDTTLSVTTAGIINPRGIPVRITVFRTSDMRVEGTLTSTTTQAVSIPPGRREDMRRVTEDGIDVFYLPTAWTLTWSCP